MIYLASTSPRRRKILKEMGVAFKCISPNYEEHDPPNASPSKIVKLHAMGKARSAADKIKQGVIIGSDTLVYYKKKLIGKPKNMKDAFRILGMLQGKWHEVYTGVAILHIKDSRLERKTIFHERTRVRLKAMGWKDMRAYFKKIEPLDKAGAYAIQSKKYGIVKEIKGLLSNAVGLPAERLYKILGLG